MCAQAQRHKASCGKDRSSEICDFSALQSSLSVDKTSGTRSNARQPQRVSVPAPGGAPGAGCPGGQWFCGSRGCSFSPRVFCAFFKRAEQNKQLKTECPPSAPEPALLVWTVTNQTANKPLVSAWSQPEPRRQRTAAGKRAPHTLGSCKVVRRGYS